MSGVENIGNFTFLYIHFLTPLFFTNICYTLIEKIMENKEIKITFTFKHREQSSNSEVFLFTWESRWKANSGSIGREWGRDPTFLTNSHVTDNWANPVAFDCQTPIKNKSNWGANNPRFKELMMISNKPLNQGKPTSTKSYPEKINAFGPQPEKGKNKTKLNFTWKYSTMLEALVFIVKNKWNCFLLILI